MILYPPPDGGGVVYIYKYFGFAYCLFIKTYSLTHSVTTPLVWGILRNKSSIDSHTPCVNNTLSGPRVPRG